MKILTHSRHETYTVYYRDFNFVGERSGYSFDCDEAGNFTPKNACQKKNFEACLTGMVGGKKVEDQGVEARVHDCFVPAVGQCSCGAEVILDSFTNTCDCGRDYNMSGQELAPREQWGEETGEDWFDVQGL